MVEAKAEARLSACTRTGPEHGEGELDDFTFGVIERHEKRVLHRDGRSAGLSGGRRGVHVADDLDRGTRDRGVWMTDHRTCRGQSAITVRLAERAEGGGGEGGVTSIGD